MPTRDENIKLIAEELKGRGFKEAKWPGLIIATIGGNRYDNKSL